jgi:hypothetical protein
MFLAMMLSALPEARAQLGPRAKLHELSLADLEELSGYIDEWVSAELVQEHVDYFFALEDKGGVHTTRNFLGWHRAHVRKLEHFLMTKPGGGKFVPLPAWEPTAPDGAIQPIPAFFNERDGSGTINPAYAIAQGTDSIVAAQLALAGLPDSVYLPNISPDVPYISAASPIYDMTANCTISDAGDFSDILETTYHAAGHSRVSGAMLVFSSPACLIFWPWHAQIDELWAEWDDCSAAYDISGPAYISGAESWSGERYVRGEVYVQDGGVLTIEANARIHFQDSEYARRRTRLVVEAGGKLIVQVGAALTGIGIFGQGGGNPAFSQISGTDTTFIEGIEATLKGVIYNTPWDGITLEDGGEIELQGGWIEHARIGIANPGGGGKVTASGAVFSNNRQDVALGSPGSSHQDNSSRFYDCLFLNSQALRDAIWESGKVGDLEHTHHHIGHGKSLSSGDHVTLWNVSGPVFEGCGFRSTYKPMSGGFASRGIFAVLSSFRVEGGSGFLDLAEGIYVLGDALAAPALAVTIEDNTFSGTVRGVTLEGASMAHLSGNIFQVPGTNTLTGAGQPYGVFIRELSSFIVQDNTFRTMPNFTGAPANAGLIVEDACFGQSQWAARNTFENLGYHTESRGANFSFQIACNGYAGLGDKYAIAVTSGILGQQGDCNEFPAGNAWDDTCSGTEGHIYLAPSAQALPYSYYALDPPQVPDAACVSSGVALEACMSVSDPQFCANLEPVLSEGNGQARANRLAAIEQALQSAGPEEAELLERAKQAELMQALRHELGQGGPGAAYSYLQGLAGQQIQIEESRLASWAVAAGQYAAAQQLLGQLDTGSYDYKLLDFFLPIAQEGRGMGQLTLLESQHLLSIPPPCYIRLKEMMPARAEEGDAAAAAPQPRSAPARSAAAASLFEAYPNPASSLLHIRLPELAPGQEARLWLSDWAGRRLREARSPGAAALQWDIAGLPAGAYILGLEAGAASERKAIIIAR